MFGCNGYIIDVNLMIWSMIFVTVLLLNLIDELVKLLNNEVISHKEGLLLSFIFILLFFYFTFVVVFTECIVQFVCVNWFEWWMIWEIFDYLVLACSKENFPMNWNLSFEQHILYVFKIRFVSELLWPSSSFIYFKFQF